MDHRSLPSTWVQKRDRWRHATSMEKAEKWNSQTWDQRAWNLLLVLPLNLIWSLSSICLSFTMCKMTLGVSLLIASEECYWGEIRELNSRYLFKSYVSCEYTHVRLQENKQTNKRSISVPLGGDLPSLSGDAFPMPDVMELFPLGSVQLCLLSHSFPLQISFSCFSLESQPRDLKPFFFLLHKPSSSFPISCHVSIRKKLLKFQIKAPLLFSPSCIIIISVFTNIFNP